MENTTLNLLKQLDDLDTLMKAQLGKIANKNGAIKYAEFTKYCTAPDSQKLFRTISQTKAELRALGVNVPVSFPDSHVQVKCTACGGIELIPNAQYWESKYFACKNAKCADYGVMQKPSKVRTGSM